MDRNGYGCKRSCLVDAILSRRRRGTRSDPVNEQVRDGHDLSAPQLTHLAEVHHH